MDRRLSALVEVFLIFLLVAALPMVLSAFPKALFAWPVNSIVGYLAYACLILALLVVTGRNLPEYGISLRNVDLDLKVVAIWVIPLCFINILTIVSWTFNLWSFLAGVLLLSAIEALIIFIMPRVSTGIPPGKKPGPGILMAIPAAAIVALAVVPATFLPTMTTDITISHNAIYFFIISFALVGPVEELVFRGYMQSRLNGAFGRQKKLLGVSYGMGIVIASLLFGLWHAFNSQVFNPLSGKYGLDLAYGIMAFLFGLIVGFVREKTGSIVAPTILHAAVDFFGAFFS